eukprot:NODE_130_length_18488_cov_0.389961.p6 type:complete len:269 gc:universal NODE_130_length_18488_cov_0.389961:2320-3126(+)
MEKHFTSIDSKIKDKKIYEAHQYSMSMARRIRKKSPKDAIDLLAFAVKSLAPYEDTLEIAKYPLLMAKEDAELTAIVIEFCIQSTLNWANQVDWLLEWDKVCTDFNNKIGNSAQIPTAFTLKYIELGLLDQALIHLGNAPLEVLKKAIKLIDDQRIPLFKKHQYSPLVPMFVKLLAEDRTGAVIMMTKTILDRDLYEKEFELFEIIYTMARAAQSDLDKRVWIELRMLLEQRIGVDMKKDLDVVAHVLFNMPLKKQMTMSEMMKTMMG